MHPTQVLAVCLAAVVVGATGASAQPLSAYRDYAFGASVDAIVAQTASQQMSVTTVHQRPAKIQRLEWFAGYTPDGPGSDPVRGIVFGFVDDQLYEMVVTYDTRRTAGLTTSDVVAALSTSYGEPLPADRRAARAPRVAAMGIDTVVAASWRDATGTLSLYRNLYAGEYQLLLRSTALATRAAAAAATAEQLDRIDGPRLEREQRLREAEAAKAAAEKARVANKAAFRP
jgi:hypothetical protein